MIQRDTIAGLIRHFLTTAGGVVVAKGWASEDDVSLAAGALATLFGIGWSIWQKRASRKATESTAGIPVDQ